MGRCHHKVSSIQPDVIYQLQISLEIEYLLSLKEYFYLIDCLLYEFIIYLLSLIGLNLMYGHHVELNLKYQTNDRGIVQLQVVMKTFLIKFCNKEIKMRSINCNTRNISRIFNVNIRNFYILILILSSSLSKLFRIFSLEVTMRLY